MDVGVREGEDDALNGKIDSSGYAVDRPGHGGENGLVFWSVFVWEIRDSSELREKGEEYILIRDCPGTREHKNRNF